MPSPSSSLRARVTAAYRRLGPGVRELLAFGIIGALNLVLNIALFAALTTLSGLDAGWASFISASVTTVLSFVLNRRYAFTSAAPTGIRAFGLFVLVNLAGIGIETGLVAGAADVFDIRTALPLDAVKIVAIGVGTVFRYVAYRYLVFPPSTAAPDDGALDKPGELVRGVLPVRAYTD